MHAIPFLREYARRLTQALHWIKDRLDIVVDQLQEQCPNSSPFSLAEAVCDAAIIGAFET